MRERPAKPLARPNSDAIIDMVIFEWTTIAGSQAVVLPIKRLLPN